MFSPGIWIRLKFRVNVFYQSIVIEQLLTPSYGKCADRLAFHGAGLVWPDVVMLRRIISEIK